MARGSWLKSHLLKVKFSVQVSFGETLALIALQSLALMILKCTYLVKRNSSYHIIVSCTIVKLDKQPPLKMLRISFNSMYDSQFPIIQIWT